MDEPIVSASDEALVGRARDGERDAFAELVRRHQDAVFRLVKRVGRLDAHRAEDLAQDTFVRAWEGLAGFRGACPFRNWLFRIAHNLTLNREATVAARAARRTASLDAPLGDQDGEMHMDPHDHRHAAPHAGAEHAELGDALRGALDRIPDEFRAPVLLRDVEGLDYDAIADVLDVPIGTVRSRIHRGREALREILIRTYGTPAFESGPGGVLS